MFNFFLCRCASPRSVPIFLNKTFNKILTRSYFQKPYFCSRKLNEIRTIKKQKKMKAQVKKMIEKEVEIAMSIPEVRELVNKMSTKEAKADLLAKIIIAIA